MIKFACELENVKIVVTTEEPDIFSVADAFEMFLLAQGYTQKSIDSVLRSYDKRMAEKAKLDKYLNRLCGA